MNVFIKYWYRFSTVILILMVIWMIVFRPQFDKTQLLLIFNLMALFAHQFEEYQFPGGAPMIINRVVYDEKQLPDRYPGNSLSICLVNTSAWVIYLISIIFSNVYWLGLGVILFSLFQILGHALEMNIKLHTWYNPGLATTLLLFLPLGWYFISYLTRNGLINGYDWLFAVVMLLACIVITIVLPVQSLKNRQTKYPIDEWQVRRYKQVINFAQIGK